GEVVVDGLVGWIARWLITGRCHDVGDDRVIVVDVENDVVPEQIPLCRCGGIVGHFLGFVPADVITQYTGDLTDPIGTPDMRAEFRREVGLTSVDPTGG